MNDKKIKIPNGMLKAAVDAAVKFSGASTIQASPRVRSEIERSFNAALEAALLWLTDNPSQPDEEQMDALCSKHSWLDKDSVRYGAREWQRRMFLAPAPNPVVDRVKQALTGVTLTAGDAAELMDAVYRCTSPDSE